MFLILRCKPEHITYVNGSAIAYDEDGNELPSAMRKKNHGGRAIAAEESPTRTDIEPGDAFLATLKWYAPREHWHFLEVIERSVDVDSVSAAYDAKGIKAILDAHEVVYAAKATKEELAEQVLDTMRKVASGKLTVGG